MPSKQNTPLCYHSILLRRPHPRSCSYRGYFLRKSVPPRVHIQQLTGKSHSPLRRFSCQSGSGQANKSDHKVSRNTGDGRGGDDDDGWQAGGKKPPPPPQRRGTVAAGIGWEESLRSSAVGVSQRENSDDRKVNARKGSGSGGLKEDVAGKGAGKELQPRGQVEQTHWSSGSSIRSRMQSDGQESMHRWLQVTFSRLNLACPSCCNHKGLCG